METRHDDVLLGGTSPELIVNVAANCATYEKPGGHSSIDEVVGAFREAATYRSSISVIVALTIIATIIALAIRPWTAIVVAIAAMVLLVGASKKASRRRRVPILYRIDEAGKNAFDSLANGIGWLGNSRAVWHSGSSARVTRGEAANILTNVAVPAITFSNETLLFFPDALFVRDHSGNFAGVAYGSIEVASETTRVQETGTVPTDSKTIGQTWRYTNKDGSPDRRRSHNPVIPIAEYARIVLRWRGTERIFFASNVASATHFADGVQSMVRFRNPAAPVRSTTEKPMSISSPRLSTAPTDLELLLQASIARKQRLAELEREPVVATPLKIDANQSWIAKGGSTNVHGFATGDLVYVGQRVPSFDGDGIEPSAIDPNLPVDFAHANTLGEGVTYWPSYHSISAAGRAAYLQWLNGGRNNEQVYIGYVFIFFYGLERRVYEYVKRRGSPTDELLAIAHEVARLLKLHADRSSSFERYAESLLDLIASIEPRARSIASSLSIQPGNDVPRRIAIELGEHARAGKPIPANLAYDWLRATQYLNTPATRCEREFELLFHIRYAKQFGDGLFLQANKTRILINYHPASAALDPLELRHDNLPDVTEARPLAKLAELAQECSGALDAFSRFLGRYPAARESLAAFALLPDDLVEGTHSADAKALAALVASRLDEHGRAQLGTGELLQYVRVANPEKVSKNEAMLLAQALEKLGYGIEPDLRLGGPVIEIDDPVVVFRRLPDCPSTASDEYATAMICMRLGTVVSAADDEISVLERTLLEQHIAQALQLSMGERQRLGAHLAWLVEAKPGTSGLKKRLAALSRDARHHIGRLLVSVATTDTHVDPREMRMLEKLYAFIGLESSDLYRDVHAAQATDDEPIVVDAPAAAPKGFSIPPKPTPAPTTAAGLDMSRVRLKIAETRQVSALLGSIFVEDEAPPAAAAPAPTTLGTIGTLDAAHSELLRRLAESESWPRQEVERMASELSLMTDGALETINDYAYATADEALWEDDDPLAINGNVAMELIR